DLAQRGVQQVCRRVVQSSGLAYGSVHGGFDAGPHPQATAVEDAVVQEGATGLAGVAHVKTQTFAGEVAAVADLSTGFGIERRLVEHHYTLFAGIELLNAHAFAEQRNNLAVAGGAEVAGEAGLTLNLDQAVVIHAEGAGRPRALALGLHFALEAFLVQSQLALAGDVAGEIHRETVGVVQLEDHLTGNDAAGKLGQILLENLQALLQRLGELLFFVLEHALDMRLLLLEFGESLAHFGDQRGYDLVEEAALGTQFVAMTTSATNDTAQHVATTFVGRRYAIGNQEAAGANMVGDHLERGLAFVGAPYSLCRRVQ